MGKKTVTRRRLVHVEQPPLPAADALFDCLIPATRAAKAELLEQLLCALVKQGLLPTEDDQLRARLALDEALLNAIIHGCRCDPARSVRVRAFAGQSRWSVLVEDEGQGFREQDLPDHTRPADRLAEGGRGVALIRGMMDQVSYWRSGSALLISQRRRRP
jgi:serine/threonine-protein kinase RsbW